MTTEPAFGLDDIGQIAITAHDIDRATSFYRNVLGMRFLFGAPGLAFFACGGVRLMLSVPEGEEFDHPGSVVYYRVPDIVAAHRELQARGVAFAGDPHVVHRAADYDLWMAFFKDTEGNMLALMAEQGKPADD